MFKKGQLVRKIPTLKHYYDVNELGVTITDKIKVDPYVTMPGALSGVPKVFSKERIEVYWFGSKKQYSISPKILTLVSKNIEKKGKIK